MDTLHQARIDAALLSEPVSVCASNDGATCTGSKWEAGWIVFTGNSTPGTVDGSDFVLRAGQPIDSKINLTIDSGGVPYIRFLPTNLGFV